MPRAVSTCAVTRMRGSGTWLRRSVKGLAVPLCVRPTRLSPRSPPLPRPSPQLPPKHLSPRSPPLPRPSPQRSLKRLSPRRSPLQRPSPQRPLHWRQRCPLPSRLIVRPNLLWWTSAAQHSTAVGIVWPLAVGLETRAGASLEARRAGPSSISVQDVPLRP